MAPSRRDVDNILSIFITIKNHTNADRILVTPDVIPLLTNLEILSTSIANREVRVPFYEKRFSEFFYELRERDAVGGCLVHQGRGKALSRTSHQENDSRSVLVAVFCAQICF